MSAEKNQIIIIGAGVSGLIAAINLEKQGLKPTILEASGKVGGRLKTDLIKGHQLDHGFQVLLTAYPLAKKYLDYSQLELQEFYSGSILFKDGKKRTIADPTRHFNLIFKTIGSNLGSLGDKMKILSLVGELKSKDINQVFSDYQGTTLSFLKKYGFSDLIIHDFFKPFFAGIFLETALETPSSMFAFVFKMFAEGRAGIPKGGIAVIPSQLVSILSETVIRFNAAVDHIDGKTIKLANGEDLTADIIINATNLPLSLEEKAKTKTGGLAWKSCDTLYYETETPVIDGPFIGLVCEEGTLINNLFYHQSLACAHVGNRELLSVTVVKAHGLDEADLIAKVERELQVYCHIKTTKFLKRYHISQALPKLKNLQSSVQPETLIGSDNIITCGDHVLYASLNAAMRTGELAAEAVKSLL